MTLSDSFALKTEEVVSAYMLAAEEELHVQTIVALLFWSRGEDGGGVKITLESAIRRVHTLPECELLSFSSAFWLSLSVYHLS